MIQYKSGYKYQLVEDYSIQLGYHPEKMVDDSGHDSGPLVEVGIQWVPRDVFRPFIHFEKNGVLTIKKGYAWDGPSGPTFDTPTFMRAALVHDALYQLIRVGELAPQNVWRRRADYIMRDLCLEDGMSRFRAWYAHLAVRHFGHHAVADKKEVHTAP